MSPTEPVLQVRGLSKSFGANTVLRGIDLDVPRGKVVALIGPSGSGKTTILRSLNGLETPDAGSVTVGARGTSADGAAGAAGGPGSEGGTGVEPVLPALTLDFGAKVTPREVAALRDRSAMVFQHYNLFPHLTVLQNVIEGPVRVQKRPRAEVVAEAEKLLDRVGLLEKKDAHPFELSGGQQQRVGIVRALALKPQLLLFDEPTSALDPELVDDVLEVIKELAEEGWTMVIVTHELAFARQTADEVVFMAGGVVVERGPASQVLRNPQEERTQAFVRRLLHEI
ncbi:cystine transport system ATP-binding protein [Arthrobacter silviterrae]|uniref:Amino acid ABC transporter ATP-binding protein n=1 Tax=Arthrobacter silviterrae TaxID=2026658 RepID=A0ABX0DIR9_9MICC|nr:MULTISPECIES: amino acid ABC transporter ATP-binding protein [Arthrobacter]MCU6480827.1 amino acid ABC transporter ATP-binding protein [Arthrobacter sp. A2-55]MDQ0278983.1 cystine transport system ATP-binding protein [Arthrobacter silviterrae]NGN85330.1 amino acid ABC transporter ATP-binding protein [Arthrobacter silviterrae]